MPVTPTRALRILLGVTHEEMRARYFRGKRSREKNRWIVRYVIGTTSATFRVCVDATSDTDTE